MLNQRELARVSSRTKTVSLGFLTSGLQYVLYVGLQAAITPIVLRYAGRETLGAYSAIMQAILYLALIDLGLSATMSRFLAQCSGSSDSANHFRRVLTTGKTVLLLTNIVFGLLVLLLGHFCGAAFKLSANLAGEAQRGLILLAGWAVARTPWAAYNLALVASQELATANLIALLQCVLRFAASTVALISGRGLFGLIAAAVLAEVFASALYAVRFRSLYPQRIPGWGIKDKDLLHRMLRFGAGMTTVRIAGLLTFNSGAVLIGSVMGPVAVSIYYVSQMPAFAAYSLALRLPDSAAPSVNELWGQGRKESVRTAFVRLQRITTVLATLIAGGILLFNREIIQLWVGLGQYAGDSMTIALALLALIMPIQHLNYTFAVALGRIKLLSALALIEGVAAVSLSLVLLRVFGLAGVSAGIAIGILPKTIVLYLILIRQLNVEFKRDLLFWLPRPLIALAGSLSLSRLLSVRLFPHQIANAAVQMTIFLACYCLLCWLLALEPADKRRLVAGVQRFLHHRSELIGIRA